jgi:hypothetical protein
MRDGEEGETEGREYGRGSGIGSDVIPSVLKNGCVHWLRYAHSWLVAVLAVVWCA